TYMVQLGGWQGPGGTGTLDVSLVGDADVCCGAVAIGEGAHAYDTSAGTTSGAATCDGDMGNDTWFAYTASCNGDATLSTCGQTGTDSDSVLIVYDSCANANGTCLVSSDDACGASNFMSTVTLAVTAGTTYMVQLGGWQGPGGTGTLDVSLVSAAEGNCADGIDDDCDGLTDCDDSDCAGSIDCSNDDCSGAYPVGEGVHAYDTSAGSTDGPTDCDSDMSNDHWFLYSPSANGVATIDTCLQTGTDTDSVLIVYDGAAGCPTAGGACIASSDDGCGASGYMSSVSIGVEAGNTYLIQLGGWQGPGGTGDLSIGLVPCTTDACCGAAAIGEGAHAYDTSAGTTSGTAACDVDMGNDTWFAYTASGTGTATLSTCGQTGTDGDSVLIVYDSCANANGACLVSNDDGCGASGYMSEVSLAVTGGTTYMVQLGGWAGPGGTGTLDVSLVTPASCEGAIAMVDGANAFDTTGYPGTGTAPTGCTSSYGNNAADGWYTYTPAADGLVDINTCDPASHDTDLAVYEGDCSAPILVACDGDGGTATGCQGFDSALNGLVLTGGVTYLINIGGWGASDSGPGTCNITFTPLAAEDCNTPGDEDGDGDADCADSDCATAPQCVEAGNCTDSIDNDGDGLFDCDDPDCDTDPSCAGCPTALSQTAQTIPEAGGSVSCAGFEVYWARSYDSSSLNCPNGMRVTSISFAIQQAVAVDPVAGQTIDLEIYLDSSGGAANFADCTLLSSESFTVMDSMAGTYQTHILATPVALQGCQTVVVAVHVAGTADLFRTGVALGETADSYLASAPCGLPDFTPVGAIGFPGSKSIIDLGIDDQGAGPCPIAGDECSSAIAVTEGANAFDTTGFTDSLEDAPTGCTSSFGANASDGWYLYTATVSGNVVIDTCDPASFDTDVSAYSGGCGSLTLLACDGDSNTASGCQGFDSRIDIGTVLAGDSVIIRVGGWGASDQGPGTLNITSTPPPPTIHEIRTDQPGGDNDEYFELAGFAQALDGLSYIVIGDGTGGSGTIESVTDLTGQAMGGSGFWVAGESSMTLATPDMVTTLGFENSDNTTHLLVRDFTGASGDDLDTDDDGVLDVEPWSEVVDGVALLENEIDPVTGNTSGGELVYSSTTAGPDGPFAPGHVEICNGEWNVADFDPAAGTDTPGAANSCLAPPENDECDTAFPAVLGSNSAYNVSATDSADPWDPAPCGGGAMAADVWHVWTADTDGTLTVSTCDTGGYDTDISLSTGSCGALTQIACSGDAGDGSGAGGTCQAWYSEYSAPVTAGTTYYLRTGGWSAADQGATNLELSFSPVGDNPCDALVVTDGVTVVDTTLATDSGTVIDTAQCDSGMTQGGADMWYSYTAAIDGTVNVHTCDIDGFDTDLSVHLGDCAALTIAEQIACSGDATILTGCQSYYSDLEFAATAGTEYLIRVDGWNGGQGVTNMTITNTPDAVDPTANFVLSGYSEFSINFRPVTLTDSSDNGGDETATITVDWGDGSPTETAALGSSLPHVYAIALVPGATGFLATPSVTVNNIVGSDTATGDTLTILLIGDANNDLNSDAADVVTVLTYLYGGGSYNCYQVADLNGDEIVDLGDVVYVLYYFFVPGSDIPVLPSNPNCDL
ncbi:MAG: hypothetical protein OSB09_08840, partial [Planctomycetota bacterium]|nr:hypothetical protein [Planctomycetota bacterium]